MATSERDILRRLARERSRRASTRAREQAFDPEQRDARAARFDEQRGREQRAARPQQSRLRAAQDAVRGAVRGTAGRAAGGAQRAAARSPGLLRRGVGALARGSAAIGVPAAAVAAGLRQSGRSTEENLERSGLQEILGQPEPGTASGFGNFLAQRTVSQLRDLGDVILDQVRGPRSDPVAQVEGLPDSGPVTAEQAAALPPDQLRRLDPARLPRGTGFIRRSGREPTFIDASAQLRDRAPAQEALSRRDEDLFPRVRRTGGLGDIARVGQAVNLQSAVARADNEQARRNAARSNQAAQLAFQAANLGINAEGLRLRQDSAQREELDSIQEGLVSEDDRERSQARRELLRRGTENPNTRLGRAADSEALRAIAEEAGSGLIDLLGPGGDRGLIDFFSEIGEGNPTENPAFGFDRLQIDEGPLRDALVFVNPETGTRQQLVDNLDSMSPDLRAFIRKRLNRRGSN